MNLRQRIEKLERRAKPAQRQLLTRDMTGVTYQELDTAVNGAIDASDRDLLQQIESLVDELAQEPLQNLTTHEKVLDVDGKELPTPHFFLYWLWGLEAGSWRLPVRLSREILEGFCGRWGYLHRRCEDCLTALGNARNYEECSVCGGTHLSWKNGYYPPGDAEWIYTPQCDRTCRHCAQKTPDSSRGMSDTSVT